MDYRSYDFTVQCRRRRRRRARGIKEVVRATTRTQFAGDLFAYRASPLWCATALIEMSLQRE